MRAVASRLPALCRNTGRTATAHPAPHGWLALAGFALACGTAGTPAPSAGPTPAAAPTAPAPPPIAVGRCTHLKGLAETKAAGFDYAELAVRDIAVMTDDEFAQALAGHKALGLPTPAGNQFLPPTMSIVGPKVSQASKDEELAYVRKAFDRSAQLGIKIIVLGSGKARMVPDGFPRDQAFAQLVDFARRIAPEAQARGIVVAVEPLRKQESNIINTAAEGLTWVEAVGHPNFQLMVDFFHLAIEKEDPSILVRAKAHIRHLHFANPNGRVFPLDAAEYDYAPFFAQVKASGYQGGISVEAKPRDFAQDAPKSIALLRAGLGAGPPPAPAASPATGR